MEQRAARPVHCREITTFAQMLEAIRAGKRVVHSISLAQPSDQTEEYDRAIKMVEMTQADTIELEEDRFDNLVMDRWAWTRQFMHSNSFYSEKARSKTVAD